ncbi:MAG: DUF2851 family protein [Flavobacteriaceae bacterium]|nr:DUF2851 family protein [Flavobacteriaceae bacterium]
MKEDFIAFIWKHQYFKKDSLKTVQGESLRVVTIGEENTNTGPDFFNAQVIINDQKWAGNLELHVKSSDWYVHGHEKDPNYDNVVLHVVWRYDTPVFRSNNSQIATLELSKYMDISLMRNYQELFSKERKWINCEHEIATVEPFLLRGWLERLYFERLEQKSYLIFELLEGSKNDWEAVLFQLVAKNFGLKVNGAAFFELAKNIDFSIVRKEAAIPGQLEALLFGQAGLLNESVEDGFFMELKNKYDYQSKKYRLALLHGQPIRFFRLRPNNFPTIRLAQLAALYDEHQNLFSKIINATTLEAYYLVFDVATSSFWDTHYTFEAVSARRPKRLTKSFIDLLLINTIIPLKFIYQKNMGQVDEQEILNLIRAIKPEKNSIIEKFSQLDVDSDSAFSTQSLLQLKNEYCNRHRCLECQVGATILRKH